MTPRGLLNFTSGIVYGTQLVENTTNLDSCVRIIDNDFIASYYIMKNKTLEIEVFPVLYALYDVAYNVHPLIVSCFGAPDTSWQILQ